MSQISRCAKLDYTSVSVGKRHKLLLNICRLVNFLQLDVNFVISFAKELAVGRSCNFPAVGLSLFAKDLFSINEGYYENQELLLLFFYLNCYVSLQSTIFMNKL